MMLSPTYVAALSKQCKIIGVVRLTGVVMKKNKQLTHFMELHFQNKKL
jgi:hypothetical protein